MKCFGVEISCFILCKKIHELSKNKTVKYGSNAIGVIPIVGTAAGIVRIAAHIFFRKCHKSDIYWDQGLRKADMAKFKGIKVVQGVAELIPILGPGIFWICRGGYLAVKKYQNYKKQKLNPFGDDNN